MKGVFAVAQVDTWLKKVELAGGGLPANARRKAAKGSTLHFSAAAKAADESYWLAVLSGK
jgi:hypothetical protein